jgi:ribose/xylose/arabinose/galactoside ABC-type transport system permease subunit
MPLGLLILVLLLQLVFRDVPLFSLLNMKNILLETVSISMTALGLTYIMISGEGDLSFAGLFSLLTVVFAVLANHLNQFSISFLAIAALAVGVNFVIAFLVTRLGSPPLLFRSP